MNIRKIFQAKENRVLGENIFSLGLLNIVNYIFPLLIIPHLTRTLGRENYGLYAFATVVVGYIALFIRYGFAQIMRRSGVSSGVPSAPV